MANQPNERITIFIVGVQKGIDDFVLVLQTLKTLQQDSDPTDQHKQRHFTFTIHPIPIENISQITTVAFTVRPGQAALQISGTIEDLRTVEACAVVFNQNKKSGQLQILKERSEPAETPPPLNPGIESITDIKPNMRLNGVMVRIETRNKILGAVVDIGLIDSVFIPFAHAKDAQITVPGHIVTIQVRRVILLEVDAFLRTTRSPK